MFRILKDLLRYNREFALGAILILLVVAMSLASFFSPYPSGLQYVVPFDVPPSWDLSLRHQFARSGRLLAAHFRHPQQPPLRHNGRAPEPHHRARRRPDLRLSSAGSSIGVLMSINDTFVVFPPFPILVLVYFIFKDHMSWALLAVAMASLGWPYDARLIRSVALSLRTREFTTQSLFSGMSTRQILVEEHLPYVLPIVFATTMNNINWSIGLEVTLSVIGFTNIETPTIGTMIYWANQHTALVAGVWWWIAFPVGLVIMTFIGLYLLSVSMNEYIDPRSRLSRMGGARLMQQSRPGQRNRPASRARRRKGRRRCRSTTCAPII